MNMEVSVVVGGVFVEIGRMNHVQAHVPVCVGQLWEVGVVGCWVWRGLAALLTVKLSGEWKEEEQYVCECLSPAGRLPLVAGTCVEIG